MDLCVRPGKAVLALGAMVFLLAAAHVTGLICRFGFGHPYVHGLVPLFDLDREHNIPSLYAAFSLMLCSGLLVVEAGAARQAGDRWHRCWGGLAAIFLLLALDEQFALHERLILPLQGALGVSGYLYFAWVIPYTLGLLVLGIAYLHFLFNLRPATRRRFTIAAVVYLAGALGLELIGGAFYERIGGLPDLSYAVLVTVEELLEMSGVIIFIHALLADLGANDLRIRFRGTVSFRPPVSREVPKSPAGVPSLRPNRIEPLKSPPSSSTHQ